MSSSCRFWVGHPARDTCLPFLPGAWWSCHPLLIRPPCPSQTGVGSPSEGWAPCPLVQKPPSLGPSPPWKTLLPSPAMRTPGPRPSLQSPWGLSETWIIESDEADQGGTTQGHTATKRLRPLSSTWKGLDVGFLASPLLKLAVRPSGVAQPLAAGT